MHRRGYLKSKNQHNHHCDDDCSLEKSRVVVNDLIRKCKLQDDNDPLEKWLNYIDFIKQNEQKSNDNDNDNANANLEKQLNERDEKRPSLFVIMKRCTNALLNHPKYTNDTRFIRIIVMYADQIEDSNEKEEIFRYYYKHKIGVQTAIFWISWAFVMEKNYDYKAANRIYSKAIRINVQPMKILTKRYRGFQLRVQYYGIDLGKSTNDFPEDVKDMEKEEEDSSRSCNHDSDNSKSSSRNDSSSRSRSNTIGNQNSVDDHEDYHQEQHRQHQQDNIQQCEFQKNIRNYHDSESKNNENKREIKKNNANECFISPVHNISQLETKLNSFSPRKRKSSFGIYEDTKERQHLTNESNLNHEEKTYISPTHCNPLVSFMFVCSCLLIRSFSILFE